jgi:hypothetical protein
LEAVMTQGMLIYWDETDGIRFGVVVNALPDKAGVQAISTTKPHEVVLVKKPHRVKDLEQAKPIMPLVQDPAFRKAFNEAIKKPATLPYKEFAVEVKPKTFEELVDSQDGIRALGMGIILNK